MGVILCTEEGYARREGFVPGEGLVGVRVVPVVFFRAGGEEDGREECDYDCGDNDVWGSDVHEGRLLGF
jgi:hypothetical protein